MKPNQQHQVQPVTVKPSLSYDTARCQGGADKLCDICLRFLAPGNPYRQAYMSPPASIKRGECASHIPQGVRNAS